MHHRRASGKILASVVLILMGVVLGAIIISWDTVFAPNDSQSYHLVMDTVYFVEPVSVENAKWEIALIVRNDGKQEVLLRNVYVCKKPVEEYGLTSGGSLSSRSVIGTSLPHEGLNIESKARETIRIWIGSDRFSSGSQITVHILNPDIIEYTRNITLR